MCCLHSAFGTEKTKTRRAEIWVSRNVGSWRVWGKAKGRSLAVTIKEDDSSLPPVVLSKGCDEFRSTMRLPHNFTLWTSISRLHKVHKRTLRKGAICKVGHLGQRLYNLNSSLWREVMMRLVNLMCKNKPLEGRTSAEVQRVRWRVGPNSTLFIAAQRELAGWMALRGSLWHIVFRWILEESSLLSVYGVFESHV